MLRKHLPKLIGVVILLFLFSVLLIPDLALRTAVFWRSPVKAFTMEYEEDVAYEKRDGLDETTKLYRITKNIPHEEATDADLVIWQVSRWGPFYIGDYYGWGPRPLLPKKQSYPRRQGCLGGVFYGRGIFSLRLDGIYGTLRPERMQSPSKKRKLRKRVFHASII